MRETKIKTNQIDYDFDGHGGGAESITLLSITTAPQAPFKAGDRFYSNEETEQFEANMIYKAVVDNSWEYAEALSPELGVFYIFDGETYLYDAKIESLFKIGDSTSSNELYILNQTLPANTTTLTTEVDFSENFLINVYVNGLLQSKDLHYYVSGTNIIFTSTFEEAVNVIILYTSSSDVNINNTPTGTVNYNELINKPKINNVELIGNKTYNDLKLQNKLKSGSNIYLYEHPEETFVDFSGFGFYKDHFVLGTDLTLNNNRVTGFPYFRLISVGTLIFLNGKLLNLLDDYFIESVQSLYLNVEVNTNDVLSVIYGLSILTKIGNQTGTTIPCDYYIDGNLLVFKNGYLLKNDQYYFNNGSLVFTTALVSTDILVFVKAVTNVGTQESTTGEYLNYKGPEDNLVFKNGRLLALRVDYDIEEYDINTSQGTLKFNTPLLSTDIITFVNNEPNSIYNLLGDKLNYLPVFQSGKVLSNDGYGLKWIDANGTTDYTNLTNKPSINNITLSGNKSADDLGLQDKLTWTYTEATETLEVE